MWLEKAEVYNSLRYVLNLTEDCLHRVTIAVPDLEGAKAFNVTVLAPLGYNVIMDIPERAVVGLGADNKPDFWLARS